jgi:hypothetical protein
LGSYTRTLLVSQDRRQFFVTPWFTPRCDVQKRIKESFVGAEKCCLSQKRYAPIAAIEKDFRP